jgi:hypothetical protein
MSERVLDAGVATRPLSGEASSGDLAVIELLPDGALVAALDGLGHGPEAAHAAGIAAAVLREFAGDSAPALVERCHAALRDTRGVALSLAAFSAARGTLTWLGVGNVEGRLLRGGSAGGATTESLVAAPGTVGHLLPPLTPATLEVRLGDTLVFATDGVARSFADSLAPSGPAQDVAERILREHGRPTDDALVVVARLLGSSR